MQRTLRRSRRATPVAFLLAVALTAAACGGDSGSDDGTGDDGPAVSDDADGENGTDADDGDEQAGGDPEVADLTVGLIPVVDVAPVIHAQEAGYFDEEGLNVETEFGVGGAALVPALISDDIQIGFGNYVSYVLAFQEGFELQIVAEGLRAVEGFSGVFVGPDSSASEPADLEGLTISTNTLNNIGPVAIHAVMTDAGADPEAITYTEVPFPEAAPTLERGDIDGSWVVQPFTSLIQEQIGAQLVLDPFSGPTDGLAVAGYAVTSAFADQNPNTVAAFQRALERATEDLADDDLAREVIGGYAELDDETLQAVVLPEFVATPDVAELQRVADLMVEAGYLDETFDLAPHIDAG